jgi:hypothetical protein
MEQTASRRDFIQKAAAAVSTFSVMPFVSHAPQSTLVSSNPGCTDPTFEFLRGDSFARLLRSARQEASFNEHLLGELKTGTEFIWPLAAGFRLRMAGDSDGHKGLVVPTASGSYAFWALSKDGGLVQVRSGERLIAQGRARDFAGKSPIPRSVDRSGPCEDCWDDFANDTWWKWHQCLNEAQECWEWCPDAKCCAACLWFIFDCSLEGFMAGFRRCVDVCQGPCPSCE